MTAGVVANAMIDMVKLHHVVLGQRALVCDHLIGTSREAIAGRSALSVATVPSVHDAKMLGLVRATAERSPVSGVPEVVRLVTVSTQRHSRRQVDVVLPHRTTVVDLIRRRMHASKRRLPHPKSRPQKNVHLRPHL